MNAVRISIWATGRNFLIMISVIKTVFITANSVDSDEMPHNGTFHLGLHCLPKYLEKV